MSPASEIVTRVAIVVSHPVQYYVPLYRQLSLRRDIAVKVFFTWHDGSADVVDRGFKQPISWDIPMTDGYQFELVANTSARPGTHRFLGLQNPALVKRVFDWNPSVVHLTGYAYLSHLSLIRSCAARKLPLLLRGDSHLLDRQGLVKTVVKRIVLKSVFRKVAGCLYVGQNNRNYYLAAGVPEQKLIYCPHSIEVERFAEPNALLEEQALAWRSTLQIDGATKVLLFAGKFEPKKCPVQLMRAVIEHSDRNVILLMVGGGELSDDVRTLAALHPERFRVLPFQNQTRMPVLYRLADAFVLPSAFNETWGLAVNESLACGRPALVSDRVGCGPDVIRPGVNGEIFCAGDWDDFRRKMASVLSDEWKGKRQFIRLDAQRFAISETETTLYNALAQLGIQ